MTRVVVFEGDAVRVVTLGQSGGQVIDALRPDIDRDFDRLLDRIELATGVDLWAGSGIVTSNRGLLPPEPRPLPPSTMTRQQRRYLARKGNR